MPFALKHNRYLRSMSSPVVVWCVGLFAPFLAYGSAPFMPAFPVYRLSRVRWFPVNRLPTIRLTAISKPLPIVQGLAVVVPEGLFVQVPKQMEGFYRNVGPLQSPLQNIYPRLAYKSATLRVTSALAHAASNSRFTQSAS